MQLVAGGALLVGERDVERQQPGGGGVDGHRGVHRGERYLLEQTAHVAEMTDRHADLAHLAAGEGMVTVVAGLRRQIESYGKAGLTLGEISAVEPVGFRRCRMAGVGAENPRLVRQRLGPGAFIGHSNVSTGCATQYRENPVESHLDRGRRRPAICDAELRPVCNADARPCSILQCSIG